MPQKPNSKTPPAVTKDGAKAPAAVTKDGGKAPVTNGGGKGGKKGGNSKDVKPTA